MTVTVKTTVFALFCLSNSDPHNPTHYVIYRHIILTNDSFKSVDNSSKVNEESISEDNQIHSDIVERESAADSFTESKYD